MQEALYGEEGFYTKGSGAGRQRDYMTSPEVGDLFGFVIADYIDRWYDTIETEEAIIIEAGCGPGSLASSIARSNLSCASNIDYRLVDISPANRETTENKLNSVSSQFSWSVHETIPNCDLPTLVIANELFDNLVFNIGHTNDVYKPFEHDKMNLYFADPAVSAHFGITSNIDRLANTDVPHDIENFRIPFHVGIGEWFEELLQATNQVPDLSLLVFDYMKSVINMEDENWLRLYVNNQRVVGVDNVLNALENGARGDITTDVTLEDLYVILDAEGFSKIKHVSQASWLLENNIDIYRSAVGQETKSSYDQLASLVQGDSGELQGNSFNLEYDTLTDESGLGAFTVVSARRQI